MSTLSQPEDLEPLGLDPNALVNPDDAAGDAGGGIKVNKECMLPAVVLADGEA
jgi:hypothetical protein